MTEVNWHSLFLGLSPSSNFLKNVMFQKPALFPFAHKEAPTMVYSLGWAILNHCKT